MAHWSESRAENKEDTDSVEAHTTDRHFPWLEQENQLESRGRTVHIHIHGDRLETTHYPRRLPEDTTEKIM
jgi:hypothetical protein